MEESKVGGGSSGGHQLQPSKSNSAQLLLKWEAAQEKWQEQVRVWMRLSDSATGHGVRCRQEHCLKKIVSRKSSTHPLFFACRPTVPQIAELRDGHQAACTAVRDVATWHCEAPGSGWELQHSKAWFDNLWRFVGQVCGGQFDSS